MRGLLFDLDIPRIVLTRASARVHPAAAFGPWSPLRLRELEDPRPFSSDWVLVHPRYCGICGSDVTQALIKADLDNPISGLVSFPHVLGHEIAGQVDGSGDWVVIDPWISCYVRGVEPCPACRSGRPAICERVLEPVLPGAGAGLHLGNIRGLPGGFSTLMVAHRTQCHPLPEGLAPFQAVLADPLAVAIHAIEESGFAGGLAVVLGAGTIGLCCAAVLRRRHAGGKVLISTAWEGQRAAAAGLGALTCGVADSEIVDAVAAFVGAPVARPRFGGRWLAGQGADLVVDAVGTAQSTETALRVVRPQGVVIRVGVGPAGRVQSTLHYYKEVRMLGSNGYGRAGPGHHLDEALQMLREDDFDHRSWLRHRFPLEHWRKAFQAAAEPGRSGAIKVVVDIKSDINA